MQRYMYKHGDHPLEGYTVQRAAGRGGFGEVYYALSDSGREVALKAVQNYEQIELRGITQCMNLKSPHLVTIFDVKYNDRGQPFVIMEYVSGPSLRTLISESPGGLGKQKAAFFLREIAKGLSHLHECGIVHRDLKPGNIFYENGYVKVGDYGLTKAISASRHSGHTITVGTVHYMAPEIGAGKYNFGIDIYALGVLLYEMLTGDVPFAGESPAEILMKHMTSEPELKNIDEPFAHVIKKAMAKDPDERYQTVQEMVEDLFGEENVRNSVSQFSPEELSIIAQKVAAKAKIDESPKAQTPAPEVNAAKADNQFAKTANNIYEKVDKIGRNVAEKVDAQVDTILGAKKTRIPGVTDPIQPAQRYFLAFISMLIVSIGTGFLQENGRDKIGIAFGTFILMNVCVSTILSQRLWLAKLAPGMKWIERVVTPFIAAILVQFVSEIFRYGGHQSIFFPMFVSMVLIDWRRISLSVRQKRLSLGSALWAGLLGAVFGGAFEGEPILIAGIMAGTSLAVQAISSYGQEQHNIRKNQHDKKYKTEFHSSTSAGVVPNALRIFWFVASIISLGFGLFFVIWGGTQNGDDYAIGVAAGVDLLILAVFFFIGACRSTFNGWFRYLIKPAIMLICILTTVTSSIYMGCMNLQEEEYTIALFLIIFPSVLLLIIISLPASLIIGNNPKPPVRSKAPQAAPGVSAYKRLWALIFCLIPFFGLHRFYVGKIGTGIIWFLTGGLFGIGQFIDFIMILTGSFKDRYGLPLIMWFDKDELDTKTSFEQAPANEFKMPEPEYKEHFQEEPPVPSLEVQEQPASRAFASSIVSGQFHPFAYLCSSLGFILAVAGMTVGFSLVLRIPYFLAAGWPSPDFTSKLNELFGYENWGGLLEKFGNIIFTVLMLISASFLIIGRRHLGIMHIIRAAIGLVLMSLVIIFGIEALHTGLLEQFKRTIETGNAGLAFEFIFNVYNIEAIITGGFLLLAAIVILAWPPRKQNILTTPQNQGVN
ncbi:MAG: protein kinase [Sedimentisphaerales bacterium]|nr:protein kinase [Sedimentisphaerales bacterium]